MNFTKCTPILLYLLKIIQLRAVKRQSPPPQLFQIRQIWTKWNPQNVPKFTINFKKIQWDCRQVNKIFAEGKTLHASGNLTRNVPKNILNHESVNNVKI